MRHRSRGFSLLEAIVALTIFSTSSMALYGWYSTNLIGLIRAEEQAQSISFMRNVDAYLNRLNITDESTGEYRANGYVAVWQATLVEPKKEGRTLAGALGFHRMGLYDLEVRIYSEEENTLLDVYNTRLVGYEPVRLPSFEIGAR